MIVMLSGKYSAPTREGVQSNIDHAEAVARKLWAEGFTVISPHNNSAHFDASATYRQYLDGYLELVGISDAIIALDGWEDSPGACEEQELAIEYGLPVYDERVIDAFIYRYAPRLDAEKNYNIIAGHARRVVRAVLGEGENKYPNTDLSAIINKPDNIHRMKKHVQYDEEGRITMEDNLEHAVCRGVFESLRRKRTQ